VDDKTAVKPETLLTNLLQNHEKDSSLTTKSSALEKYNII
jgi:hypothetical protein